MTNWFTFLVERCTGGAHGTAQRGRAGLDRGDIATVVDGHVQRCRAVASGRVQNREWSPAHAISRAAHFHAADDET